MPVPSRLSVISISLRPCFIIWSTCGRVTTFSQILLLPLSLLPNTRCRSTTASENSPAQQFISLFTSSPGFGVIFCPRCISNEHQRKQKRFPLLYIPISHENQSNKGAQGQKQSLGKSCASRKMWWSHVENISCCSLVLIWVWRWHPFTTQNMQGFKITQTLQKCFERCEGRPWNILTTNQPTIFLWQTQGWMFFVSLLAEQISCTKDKMTKWKEDKLRRNKIFHKATVFALKKDKERSKNQRAAGNCLSQHSTLYFHYKKALMASPLLHICNNSDHLTSWCNWRFWTLLA